jgi:peroxiredoxin
MTSSAAASETPAMQALEPGDIAPECMLSDTSGKNVHLRGDSIAGNPIVLVFCPQLSSRARETLNCFSRSLQAMSEFGARVFAICSEWDSSLHLNFPVLLDLAGKSFLAFSVHRERPSIVVLRRNYHIAAVLNGKPQAQAADTMSVLRYMEWEREEVSMRMHPPVLLIPDVLSQQDCARLIDVFETRGQRFVDPQPIDDFMKGADFKMRIPENGREDRIDHFFFEPETLAFLHNRLNRVWPEIFKAFHYKITKCETLRIAKYQGHRGGSSHGHRDNHRPTSYRRFAMSINLNTPDFKGGDLRFSEFGDQRYRPESGTAIVFSSSLLHEAMHVTEGCRYVLLAFLFGAT